jgi:hypothetical protein
MHLSGSTGSLDSSAMAEESPPFASDHRAAVSKAKVEWVPHNLLYAPLTEYTFHKCMGALISIAPKIGDSCCIRILCRGKDRPYPETILITKTCEGRYSYVHLEMDSQRVLMIWPITSPTTFVLPCNYGAKTIEVWLNNTCLDLLPLLCGNNIQAEYQGVYVLPKERGYSALEKSVRANYENVIDAANREGLSAIVRLQINFFKDTRNK